METSLKPELSADSDRPVDDANTGTADTQGVIVKCAPEIIP